MVFEFEGRTEKEAIEKAIDELELEKDTFDVEIIENQRSGIFKKGYVKIRVHTDVKSVSEKLHNENEIGTEKKDKAGVQFIPDDELEGKIIEFLETLIDKMGYNAKASVAYREDKKIGIKIDSSQSSILIGKKGKNLDALQLITNIYLSKLSDMDIRVVLDSENYRIRREENLVRLAYSVAESVRETKGSVLLEPMNPFERRLIHTTLNDINDVGTKSEGEGLYKQVRVFYNGVRL